MQEVIRYLVVGIGIGVLLMGVGTLICIGKGPKREKNDDLHL